MELRTKQDNEIQNFIKVWAIALSSLCYCHYTITKVTASKSKSISTLFKLCLILPVIFLFFYLPLTLSSLSLGGLTAFFLAWLSNFKLLLLAFDIGPLSTQPPLSLLTFISLASLPIQIKQVSSKSIDGPDPGTVQKGQSSSLYYGLKILVLASSVPVFDRRQDINPKILMLLYCVYLYIVLEFGLATVGFVAKSCLGLEIEPQFNEPYLATSLADFWGRRWNLMVSSTIRLTVYQPMKSICGRWIGSRWASLPAIIGSFFVSGLMHEIIFYYIRRNKPTWELTCFFALHGVCLAVEVGVKRCLGSKRRLPAVVSTPLAVGFVAVTGLWLFMPQLLMCEADVKAWREGEALIQFVRSSASYLNLSSFNSFD